MRRILNVFSILKFYFLKWTSNYGVILILLIAVGLTYFLMERGFVNALDSDAVVISTNPGACPEYSEPMARWAFFSRFCAPASQTIGTPSHPGWGYAAAIAGLLVVALVTSAFVSLLGTLRRRFTEGKMSFWLSGHYVIIGNGRVATSAIKSVYEQYRHGHKYDFFRPWTIVFSKESTEIARNEFMQNLPPKVNRRVIILQGSTVKRSGLKRLNSHRAKAIYILGDESESNRDTLNLVTLEKLASVVQGKASNLIPCHVMFEYQSTLNIYQSSYINQKVLNVFDFEPFNYYELWAQNVFINRSLQPCGPYLPLEGNGCITENSSSHVHLVIIGMNRMGIAMALEAAHLAHYPNFRKKKLKTRISFIDYNADREMEMFKGHYSILFDLCAWRYCNESDISYGTPVKYFPSPKYRSAGLGGDFLDVEWEFIKGGVESTPIRKYLEDAAADKNNILTIASCLNAPHKAFAVAAYLPESVKESASEILVHAKDGNNLIDNINADNSIISTFGKFHAFGTVRDTFVSENMNSLPALMINRVYRQTKEEMTGNAGSELISVTAARMSNFYNAHSFWSKMRSLNLESIPEELDDRQVAILAELEHNRWNMERLLLGFRPMTGAELKDCNDAPDAAARKARAEYYKQKKIHIDIRSFESLQETDPEAVEYDYSLSRALPHIYKSIINCHCNE